MTGAEMRAIRHRLGLTQVAFAKRIGVVQGHVGDMELDRKTILSEVEDRVLALIQMPPTLCGSCLCFIVDGMCSCRQAAA
jgi:DNA-binding transcriptional regulator YiaG